MSRAPFTDAARDRLAGMTFRVLCSNAEGATTLARLRPLAVVALVGGFYRLVFTRPGAPAGSRGLEITVDASGHDRHDYCSPAA